MKQETPVARFPPHSSSFFRFCGEKENRKREGGSFRHLCQPGNAPTRLSVPFFTPCLWRGLFRVCLPPLDGDDDIVSLPPLLSLASALSAPMPHQSLLGFPPVLLRASFCRHWTKHSNEWAAERESVFQGPLPPLLIKPIGR